MVAIHDDAKAIGQQLMHECAADPKSAVRWLTFANVIGALKVALVGDQKRIAVLESRLAAIEAKGVEFCGSWQRAVDYRRGSMVVYKGSLWAATSDAGHGAVPGESSDWQLAAKAGRDAR